MLVDQLEDIRNAVAWVCVTSVPLTLSNALTVCLDAKQETTAEAVRPVQAVERCIDIRLHDLIVSGFSYHAFLPFIDHRNIYWAHTDLTPDRIANQQPFEDGLLIVGSYQPKIGVSQLEATQQLRAS